MMEIPWLHYDVTVVTKQSQRPASFFRRRNRQPAPNKRTRHSTFASSDTFLLRPQKDKVITATDQLPTPRRIGGKNLLTLDSSPRCSMRQKQRERARRYEYRNNR